MTQYLSDKHIEHEHLESYLFELLQDFLEALQAKNFEKLSDLAEANFVAKI